MYSPFPVLLIEEYTRRFKRKIKNKIIKDLKFRSRLTRKKTQELGKMVKNHKLVDDVTRQKSEEIIKHAKKKGYEISEKIIARGSILSSKLKKKTKSTIKSGMNLKSSSNKDLDLLKKLGDLQRQELSPIKNSKKKRKKYFLKFRMLLCKSFCRPIYS